MKSLTPPVLCFALLLLFTNALAQVSISPTALFIDEQSRFGTFLVMNNSSEPQEVSLDFRFGYPATDSLGNAFINYEDAEAAGRYSIADWIRGFPRNFVLEPGQRQTVRLTVRPPGDIPDGMYWTRIRTTSNPLTPDVEETPADGITAQIAFNFEQVTAGFFKKGELSTGLDVRDLQAEFDGSEVTLRSHISRTGNAPFLGSLTLTITDENGNVVEQNRTSTSVYFNAVRRLKVDASDWSPGEYTAEMRFESMRNDISRTNLVQMEPVSEMVTFIVP